jgi:hypothetical protein
MTITLTREEAQQVLDALGSCEEDWIYDGEDEHPVDVYDKEKVGNAFVLLKNRLAQPEHEWQGLTDEEAGEIWAGIVSNAPSGERLRDFARAIEAKLKEKNT